MALFMPTNISPDMRGELGNGTVDVTKNMTVTWQVNGPSAMVAFTITIYLNDTASTQKYTTGKLTAGCPFYGTTYSGEAVPFSYTIPSATLSGAGITNGNDYKMVIKQFWSSSESVTQASASVFQARKDPTLTLTTPSQMSARSYTFNATYSQAQGDTLNWVRWQVASDGNLDDPIYDTGNIYGTAQLKLTYDGFFRGTQYSVRCMVQTEKGVEINSGWKSFVVNYDSYPLEGAVLAQCAGGDVSAVSVAWPQVKYVPGSPTGDYSIADGKMSMEEGSEVAWSSTNGEAMALSTPWTAVFRGRLAGDDAELFTLETNSGNNSVRYSYQDKSIILNLYGQEQTVPLTVTQKATLTIFLTPDTLMVHCLELIGGLYPSATLYPSANLFPRADTIPKETYAEIPLDYEQDVIEKVRVGGPQLCDFMKVQNGAASGEEVQDLKNGTYEATYSDNTYMLADFSSSLNAGNLGQTEDPLTGLSVYRRKEGEKKMLHLADLPMSTSQFYDYGAGSQQGPYTYYVFPTGQNTYLSDPLASNAITPLFWNWTVLACDLNKDGSYRVAEEYTFGKNLSSGNITNNNTPNIAANFTRYPTVQMSTANYKSGSLSSLIGVIDYVKGKGYSDTLALRDAIYDLSTTTKSLFLKNRKGDVLPIRIGGPIEMTTMDGARSQAQTVTLPWVEIGAHSDLSIVSL